MKDKEMKTMLFVAGWIFDDGKYIRIIPDEFLQIEITFTLQEWN